VFRQASPEFMSLPSAVMLVLVCLPAYKAGDDGGDVEFLFQLFLKLGGGSL
jgi:hypothetical protein